VSYVDQAGEELLREALAGGIRISGRSGFVAALLEAREAGEPGVPPGSATPASPDRDLVDAVLGGSEDAFLALASRCHGPVPHLVRCFAPSEVTAREIARDALREMGR
jgi:hypothetical protein